MEKCLYCGEFTDGYTHDGYGRKVGLCSNPLCQLQFDEDEREYEEREKQDALDEVEARFGRW